MPLWSSWPRKSRVHILFDIDWTEIGLFPWFITRAWPSNRLSGKQAFHFITDLPVHGMLLAACNHPGIYATIMACYSDICSLSRCCTNRCRWQLVRPVSTLKEWNGGRKVNKAAVNMHKVDMSTTQIHAQSLHNKRGRLSMSSISRFYTFFSR